MQEICLEPIHDKLLELCYNKISTSVKNEIHKVNDWQHQVAEKMRSRLIETRSTLEGTKAHEMKKLKDYRSKVIALKLELQSINIAFSKLNEIYKN